MKVRTVAAALAAAVLGSAGAVAAVVPADAAAGDVKIKNGGSVTFVVCENLTSSSGIYGKCNMSTGVASLRPGATTGWTDADGVWCGEGYRIRIHYGSDTPTYDCKGSGVGNAAGNATLFKISGCLFTCVRKVEAYRG